jgi:CheY-like chemotaxis protein
MDGYEATQRILEIAPDLPVIGQSAHVLGDEKEKCFASGMSSHISKPIDFGELIEVILKHVANRRAAP